MQLEFTKMHGLGNDFIVFDAPARRTCRRPAMAALSARHTGIGFDQALVLEAAARAGTQVYYRIFNADGGEVEQCGNGVRCSPHSCTVAWRRRTGEIVLDSPAGLIRARIHDANLDLGRHGRAQLRPQIPAVRSFGRSARVSARGRGHRSGDRRGVDGQSARRAHGQFRASAPVDRLGPAIERHPRFPKRVNVGFMEIVDRSHIRLRVFERGVGETLACGTGACAAVAVGRRHGRLDATVDVELPGGKLEITWTRPANIFG
jgi:diaminopimelate epimerase